MTSPSAGLALWPGASLEVHALLSEAPAPGEFGRPKRELFQRCPGCVALLRDVGIESFADYLKFATTTVIPTYYVFVIYRLYIFQYKHFSTHCTTRPQNHPTSKSGDSGWVVKWPFVVDDSRDNSPWKVRTRKGIPEPAAD